MLKLNKELLNELSIKQFNTDFYTTIDTLIKPYLNHTTNKIKSKNPNLIIYYINHDLYDILQHFNPYPIIINDEKLFNLLELHSREYILDNYTDRHEEQKEEYEDLLNI